MGNTYRIDNDNLTVIARDGFGQEWDLTGDGEPCTTPEELASWVAILEEQGAFDEATRDELLAEISDAPRFLAEVQAAYDKATGSWTTADWCHEVPGSRNDDGEPDYCDGGNADTCETCAEAESAASGAEDEAADAMIAALNGDWDAALRHAEAAKAAEDQFGDAPTWGPFCDAIQAAVDAR